MEIVRQKNAATYIVFPIVDADGDLVTGAAGLDSEIDAWADGSAPDGFADCTNEATEIGSTGMYYLSLTQTEMNNDYIVVQIKTSTTGAKTQVILIRTMVGDVLNIATTDDGGAINVASGVVEANVVQVSGDATAADNLESACDGTGYNVGGGSVVAASVSGAVGSVTGNVGGNVTGSVGSVASGGITAASIATGAIDADALAADAAAEIADAIWDEVLSGHTGAGSAGLALAGASAPSAADVADAVWDEAISGHLTAGTTGNALNAAGSAGDPWSTPLPGAYGAGTAGKIIGDNINAPIGTVDTVVDAIKAKTDNLPADPAATGDIPTAAEIRTEIDSNSTQLAAIVADTAEIQAELADGGRTDLLIDGIKAKTDNLPADPADDSDIDAQLATIDTNIDTLIARLTAARAGYLDNLSAGAVALASGVTVSDKTGFELSSTGIDGVLDEVVESTLTLRQVLRLMLSVLAGKSSGGGTGTMAFRDIADSKDRISASVDDDGNRTAVTRDAT